MSEEIKVGDLVMVVRGKMCCGESACIGLPFKVGEVVYWKSRHTTICAFCGEIEKSAWIACPEKSNRGFNFSQLKKINPPDEREFIRAREELTA